MEFNFMTGIVFYIINVILSIIVYRISKYIEHNYNVFLYFDNELKVFALIPVIQSIVLIFSIIDLIDIKVNISKKVCNLYDKIFGE